MNLNNVKKILIIGAFILAPIIGVSNTDSPKIGTKMIARITAFSVCEKREKPTDRFGRKLKGEDICAVSPKSLPDGTIIYIPATKEYRTVRDHIPTKSVRLHEKIARKKKVSLDICIDLHYDVSIKSRPKTKAVSKELIKYDLGYQEVYIVK